MNNEAIIYLTLMCQFGMANLSNTAGMTNAFAFIYTSLLLIAVAVNMITTGYTTYQTVKDSMKSNKLRKYYTDQHKELKSKLSKDKRNKKLQKEYQDYCMVLKAYEVKDFKKMMDDQGHDCSSILKDYMAEFKNNETIKKIVYMRKLEAR